MLSGALSSGCSIAASALMLLGCDSTATASTGRAVLPLPAPPIGRPPAPLPPATATASAAPPPSSPPSPHRDPGAADLDPANDEIVAPPDAIPDCAARLTAAGIDFGGATLPVKETARGFSCGAPDVVVYRGTGEKIRWSPAPLVSCGMALGLGRFEHVVQEGAVRTFGKRVVRIDQGGTYSCRKMARFRMVSEHSYANAIDVRSLRLEDGRTISVERDFGPLRPEPTGPPGVFLRALARRAYDDGLFSVVLTRFFDELHRDHFHLDQARYRIDGTR